MKLRYDNAKRKEANPEKKQGSVKSNLSQRKQHNRAAGGIRAFNPKDAKDMDLYQYQDDRRKREKDKKD
jgi:hypothetical protein